MGYFGIFPKTAQPWNQNNLALFKLNITTDLETFSLSWVVAKSCLTKPCQNLWEVSIIDKSVILHLKTPIIWPCCVITTSTVLSTVRVRVRVSVKVRVTSRPARHSRELWFCPHSKVMIIRFYVKGS